MKFLSKIYSVIKNVIKRVRGTYVKFDCEVLGAEVRVSGTEYHKVKKDGGIIFIPLKFAYINKKGEFVVERNYAERFKK